MAERLNIPKKSRNSADEDYHCFSGRILGEIKYEAGKKNRYGQIVPIVNFKLGSNANPKSYELTAVYDCVAWNKCAERIHALGITENYGLVCWAKFRTNRIVNKTDPEKTKEYYWFDVQRFVIKSLPAAEREAMLAQNEEDSGDDK